MSKGYVEVIIGSFTRNGMRISVQRRFGSADTEARYWEDRVRTAHSESGPKGPRLITLEDRTSKARVVVGVNKVLAFVVHGGDVETA